MKKKAKQPSFKEIAILLLIPVSILAIAFGVLYIPRLLANPQYDFIYSACEEYRCSNEFTISADGVITETQNDDEYNYSRLEQSELRRYNIASDSYDQISLAEAQALTLDTASRSPDGYILEGNSPNIGLLFGGTTNAYELKNGSKTKPVNLHINQNYYDNNLEFIGWIIE